MITATKRGHTIILDGGFRLTCDGWELLPGATWRYLDTGEPADVERPCVRCGQMPTPEGHDACLGTVPGVKAACCGHGVTEPYQLVTVTVVSAR
jgi:hypothetical protein